MPSEVEQVRTIGLLAAHEAAMGELYRLYASKLPDSADLFKSLAAAERDHARSLTDLADEVREGVVEIDPQRFSPEAALNSLDFIKQRTAEANSPGISLVKALSVAIDLEEALIEKRYYEVIETDAAEVKRVLQRLCQETAAHLAQVRRAWESARQSGG